jgi:hypothetical protein
VDPTRDLALWEAVLYNMLEDYDEALRALSIHLAANPDLRASFARDRTWWLEGVRSHPRYRQLVGAD